MRPINFSFFNKILTVVSVVVFSSSIATSVYAANAKKDVNGGSLSTGSTVTASTSSGDRAEVRFFDSVNSFKGTVTWEQWNKGHAFVQIIENRSDGGYPLLLINTNSKGNPQNVGRAGSKTVCTGVTAKKGKTITVQAKISGRSVSIKAGSCSWSGTAGTDNAYIKFGSYANNSAEGTQKVKWTSMSPVPSF